MTNEAKQVLVYTDGACEPNPGGPGGYGVVLVYKGKRKEISGGFRSTTNNRMEIYAAIKALESLREPCHVILYSDSQYLVNAINEGWVTRWKEKNWWRTTQERAVNVDLWERLLELCATHQVEWVWVRGHAGHVENERCDYLAMNALKQADLPPDEGYENREANGEGKVKVIQEGEPCRKCSTPVVKRKPQKPKKTQAYYYEYYLYCPQCQTTYMVEEAKRFFDESMSLF